MKPIKAWKLFSLKKDGSVGPLFINRRLRLEPGKWYEAEEHRTKGFAFRPGFHVTEQPYAPHLSNKNRIWKEVEISDYTEIKRPENQGGLWFLAQKMKILESPRQL